MRGALVVSILILSTLVPIDISAEELATFEKGFFDKNGDGIDDRMNHLLNGDENIGVILMLDSRPSDLHKKEIQNLGLEITHIYKYIDAIRIDSVSPETIFKLTSVPN